MTRLHERVRSMSGNWVPHMDRQSRKPSITVGGNVLEPKRIMLLGMIPTDSAKHIGKLIMSVAGASLVQDITVCHHLKTTHDDNFTESERRKAQELVKRTLFDLFRKSESQSQSQTPIEDTEVRSPTDMTPSSVPKEKIC